MPFWPWGKKATPKTESKSLPAPKRPLGTTTADGQVAKWTTTTPNFKQEPPKGMRPPTQEVTGLIHEPRPMPTNRHRGVMDNNVERYSRWALEYKHGAKIEHLAAKYSVGPNGIRHGLRMILGVNSMSEVHAKIHTWEPTVPLLTKGAGTTMNGHRPETPLPDSDKFRGIRRPPKGKRAKAFRDVLWRHLVEEGGTWTYAEMATFLNVESRMIRRWQKQRYGLVDSGGSPTGKTKTSDMPPMSTLEPKPSDSDTASPSYVTVATTVEGEDAATTVAYPPRNEAELRIAVAAAETRDAKRQVFFDTLINPTATGAYLVPNHTAAEIFDVCDGTIYYWRSKHRAGKDFGPIRNQSAPPETTESEAQSESETFSAKPSEAARAADKAIYQLSKAAMDYQKAMEQVAKSGWLREQQAYQRKAIETRNTFTSASDWLVRTFTEAMRPNTAKPWGFQQSTEKVEA